MRSRKAISTLVFVFVFISIGCTIDKEASPNGAGKSAGSGSITTRPSGSERVIVYSMHRTFRCGSCSAMEAMTGNLLNADFARELQNGRIEWRKVDFQQNEELAKRYNVAASSLVLVRMRGEQEIEHQNLDLVWAHTSDRDDFAGYVGGAIREAMSKEKT